MKVKYHIAGLKAVCTHICQLLHAVLVCCLPALWQGCSQPQPTVRPSVGQRLVLTGTGQLLGDSIFKKKEVVRLETTDDCLIKRINRLCVDDSLIFVFDRIMKQILIFHADGAFYKRIHDVGNGDKEYVQITDMALNIRHKRIVVSCDVPHKLMYYDYQGRFIKNVSLSGYYSEIACDGQSIYGLRPEKRDSTFVDRLDEEGRFLSRLSIPEARYLSIETEGHRYSFGGGQMLTTNGDTVFLTRSYDNRIYSLQGDSLVERFHLDFLQYNLPEGLIDESMTFKEFGDLFTEKGYVVRMAEVVQTPDYLFCKLNSGLCLYDFAGQTLFKYAYLGDKAGGGSSDYHSANGQNKIVSWQSASGFLGVLKAKLEYGVPVSQEDRQLYQVMKEDDNPILTFYTL